MTMARKLYRLQCIELEIESAEKELEQSRAQLGESRQLLEARQKLEQSRQHLAEIKKQQKTIEWEISDISATASASQGKLYSGNIKNPKELLNLQQEVNGLKAKQDGLEEKTLKLMEQAETETATVQKLEAELEKTEGKWREEQKRLALSIEELKKILSELNEKREQQLSGIDIETQSSYNRLRQQHGQAVALIAQGVCNGCRMSLSTVELQRAKGKGLVMCSNCGRILFAG